MDPNIKYSLLTNENIELGYFLDNKYYSMKFSGEGFEAVVKGDGYVYKVGSSTPEAKIADGKYIRLSDEVIFRIVPMVE